MVKLRPPRGGGMSCCERSPPIYLVTKEERQRLTREITILADKAVDKADDKADGSSDSDSDDICNFYEYKKQSRIKVEEYDKVLQGTFGQTSNYKEEKEKERDGDAFRYLRLTITVEALNEPKSSMVEERPPPPDKPDADDDSSESSSSSEDTEGEKEDTEGEKESEKEKAKRMIVESVCDPKPEVKHSKLSIFAASRGRSASNLSKWSQGCGYIDILERTGRPEDVIDLLMEKQPNQLQFGYVAPSLSTYLAEKVGTNNCLQVLELGDVFQESTVLVFNKLLAAFSSPSGSGPQVLRISTARFAPYKHLISLEEGMCRNTSIRTLDVAEVYLSGYNGESYCRLVAMAITSLQNLNTLDLSETRANGEDQPRSESLDPLLAVMPTNQKISVVKLRGSRLPEELMNRLVNGVCALPVLEELNVSSTNCGPKVIAGIAEVLKKDGCTLKTLNLTGLFPVENTSSDAAPSKQVIDLSPILEALNGNTSLTTLKMGGNDLPPGTVKQLAEALSTNTTLSHLHLDTLYDFDFGTFFSFLSQMKGLAWLDISDNFLEDAWLQALAKQIHSSDSSLRHIEAVDVQCSEAALHKLVEAVDEIENTSSNASHLDVSKIDDWPSTKRLYLKTKDDTDDTVVVPPRRYGEGEKFVGDGELLANYVQSKIGSLKDGTVQPRDCVLYLWSVESDCLGVEIRHVSDADKYSPEDNERQTFELIPTSREGTERAAEFIANLGIPRIRVKQEMSNAPRAVAAATKVASMASSSLQSFELKYVEFDDTEDCKIIPDNIPMMGTMKHLKLCSVKLVKPIADFLAWALSSNVEQLELESPTCKDLEAMKTVCRGFERNESLRSLKVGRTYDMSEEALLELAIGMGFLQGIDIEIDFYKASQEIIEAFCSSMSSSGCRKCKVNFADKCGSVDLSPLANSLQVNTNNSLEFLSLASQKLFEDEGADLLATALSVNTKIQKLSVTPSSFSAVASASCYTAIGAMKGLKHLEFPDASGCGDRGNCETGEDALVEALQASSCLEKLTLHDYEYAKELFPAVMKALKLSTPSTLSSVDLRLDGDSQLEEFCAAIAVNTSVKELKIRSPYDCKDFEHKLVQALSQNSTLESLTIIGGRPEELRELVALLPEAKGLKIFCIDVRQYASALWADKDKTELLEKAKGLSVSVMFVCEGLI